MFYKYAIYACIIEHIFKHVYGEKPYMSKRKASQKRFCEYGSEYSEPHTCFTGNMEKGCPKVKSGVKYMIPGAKVKNHDVLAHEWFLNFMPRPNMSIKEERKHLDMRILGRIVGV